jgi:hypothetical protein
MVEIEIEILVSSKKEYKAYIKGKTGCWALGDTVNEAVGGLILVHPEEFNIRVIY